MKIRVIAECGFEAAMLGLSLSYQQDPERMADVARRLCFRGDGHNKFLESIFVWLDMDAPRYFWQQFDTYRVGVSKQSESTMHTITARLLVQEDFASPIPASYLNHLNALIEREAWEAVKHHLPESFLQRRIVCVNYMALQRIIRQRLTHRLPEWQSFAAQLTDQVQHPELLKEETT